MSSYFEPLDLLVAGLLSHGFKELSPDEAQEGYRRFQKFGREDRWLRERDCVLLVGNIWDEDYLMIPEGSDQHRLLRKCGAIYIRTRENSRARVALAKNPKLRQSKLPLSDVEDWIKGL